MVLPECRKEAVPVALPNCWCWCLPLAKKRRLLWATLNSFPLYCPSSKPADVRCVRYRTFFVLMFLKKVESFRGNCSGLFCPLLTSIFPSCGTKDFLCHNNKATFYRQAHILRALNIESSTGIIVRTLQIRNI